MTTCCRGGRWGWERRERHMLFIHHYSSLTKPTQSPHGSYWAFHVELQSHFLLIESECSVVRLCTALWSCTVFSSCSAHFFCVVHSKLSLSSVSHALEECCFYSPQDTWLWWVSFFDLGLLALNYKESCSIRSLQIYSFGLFVCLNVQKSPKCFFSPGLNLSDTWRCWRSPGHPSQTYNALLEWWVMYRYVLWDKNLAKIAIYQLMYEKKTECEDEKEEDSEL